MPHYVLDTSAIMTLLSNEQGTDLVEDLLFRAQIEETTVYLPFMVLMELEYLLLRKRRQDEVQHILYLVENWPVEIAQEHAAWRHQAAMVKASCPVSVADAWICGLALLFDAQLVHKDPEFDSVPNLRVLRLPYKS